MYPRICRLMRIDDSPPDSKIGFRREFALKAEHTLETAARTVVPCSRALFVLPFSLSRTLEAKADKRVSRIRLGYNFSPRILSSEESPETAGK